MPKKRALQPQSIWEEAAVRAAFQAAGVKDSHLPRLYKHLLSDPDVPFASIPDLPKAACELLARDFVRATSTVESCQTSADGTQKLLVRLQDGLEIESVIMVYDTTVCSRVRDEEQETGRQRSTLCISSQVGCQMGCTFCATGTMGLVADLTAAEILEQAVHARRHSAFRNIVFMGMGEPLNNWAAVRAAVGMLTDGRVFGLRRQKVTISTVGVVPRVLQLADELPGVSLAVSLHAPTQELRQAIVPSARAYPLPRLMAALETYLDRSRHKGAKIFIEYVLLSGVNDGPEQAHELGQLLRHRPAHYMLNLIPWNPVLSPDMHFAAPSAERQAAFHAIARSYGLLCTVRREMGQDISGACGQLVVEKQQQQQQLQAGSCGGQKPQQDIEELAAAAGPAPTAKRRSIWNLFGTVS